MPYADVIIFIYYDFVLLYSANKTSFMPFPFVISQLMGSRLGSELKCQTCLLHMPISKGKKKRDREKKNMLTPISTRVPINIYTHVYVNVFVY